MVYLAMNIVTKDMYVGETKNYSKRIADEIRRARECQRAWETQDRKKKEKFVKLNRKMAQVGWARFVYFVLWSSNLDEITEEARKGVRLRIEKRYIGSMNPTLNTRWRKARNYSGAPLIKFRKIRLDVKNSWTRGVKIYEVSDPKRGKVMESYDLNRTMQGLRQGGVRGRILRIGTT